MQNFNILAGLCSSAGWFDDDHVGNPEDRFSIVAAHIYFINTNKGADQTVQMPSQFSSNAVQIYAGPQVIIFFHAQLK